MYTWYLVPREFSLEQFRDYLILFAGLTLLPTPKFYALQCFTGLDYYTHTRLMALVQDYPGGPVPER